MTTPILTAIRKLDLARSAGSDAALTADETKAVHEALGLLRLCATDMAESCHSDVGAVHDSDTVARTDTFLSDIGAR